MADDGEPQELQLIDPTSDGSSPMLLPDPSIRPPPKLESADDYSLLSQTPPSATSNARNFRSKKRNRVMQSCVACHSQKRKCDRKRPCTRCTEHGIAGQCVYQLEDPSVRDGPDQDELLRLRGRVAELERTVRVLMQKPLSRRAAAALEAETDAILGTTSIRKRKVDKDKLEEERARKVLKCDTQSLSGNAMPEWLPMPDPSFPSPADSAFSPYAPTPSESHYPHYMHFGEYTPPGDVPTPPYSTFPTPSSDAGSPFKIPEPPQRRFSHSDTTLANMLSHASMAATPESMAASSPAASMAGGHGVGFAPINGAAPPGECGCGVNPIGNEVLTDLQQSLEAAQAVLGSLPDHQVGGACITLLGISSLIDAIATATRSNGTQAMSGPPMVQPPPPPGTQPMPMIAPAPGPPPPPPSTSSYMTPSSSAHMTPGSTSQVSPMPHMSPSVSEPGPSPHSSIATPPNYQLYNSGHSQPMYHADVPTVVGINSLSSWASYGNNFLPVNTGSSSLSNFDGHKHPHPNHPLMHQHHNSNGGLTLYDQVQP